MAAHLFLPNRRVSSFLSVLFGILLCPAIGFTAGLREDHPNLIGGEVLGRGFALTVNYERFLTNQFGIGAGFMMIGSSEGLVGVVPLYASYLTGNTHSLYLGAGAAFLSEGGSVNDFASTWVLQGSIGYHYQSAGGFFVRPLFTINQDVNSDTFLIWPGITIGGSF